MARIDSDAHVAPVILLSKISSSCEPGVGPQCCVDAVVHGTVRIPASPSRTLPTISMLMDSQPALLRIANS